MAGKLVVRVPDGSLASAFSHHPEVQLAGAGPSHDEVAWSTGTWDRRLGIGTPAEVRGLVEVTDNNPMVCCDAFSVPGPMATVALLALAPAARSGLLGSPVRLALSHIPEPTMASFLLEAEVHEWHGDTSGGGPLCLSRARFARAAGSTRADVESAYAEYYDRAFFVQLGQGDPTGTAMGHVWLQHDGDDVVVSASADPRGKAGASQVVHAFNVMCGFVESLGVIGPRDW